MVAKSDALAVVNGMQLCKHCGVAFSVATHKAHEGFCSWACRPAKSLGYRYIVAVATSRAGTPMVVQHCDNRQKAQLEARDIVEGKRGIYGAIEVRVIKQGGQVTDRWARYRVSWKRTDVAKEVRMWAERVGDAEERTEDTATTFVAPDLFS